MSAFALPIPPAALTGRPSQAYGTFRYRAALNGLHPKLRYVASFPIHFRRKNPYLDQ